MASTLVQSAEPNAGGGRVAGLILEKRRSGDLTFINRLDTLLVSHAARPVKARSGREYIPSGLPNE